MKKCKQCGKLFKPGSGRALFCYEHRKAKWSNLRQRNKFPWRSTLSSIKTRCKKGGCYYPKGIKNYLNNDEIKHLWFKYRAYEMEEPSIHRINNNLHYTPNNSMFIEKRENSRLGNLGRKLPKAQIEALRGKRKMVWGWVGRKRKNIHRCKRCHTIKAEHHCMGFCEKCYQHLYHSNRKKAIHNSIFGGER